MPSKSYIRWRDPVLWPNVLAAVPPGFQAVTDRAAADRLAEQAFRGLSARRREQYRTLWKTALDLGLQPSGLLLMRVGALAPAIGLTSNVVPRRWLELLREHNVLHYVPGQLHPHGSRPGNVRTRCYLILQPCGTPAAGQAR